MRVLTILLLTLLIACGEAPPPSRIEDLSSYIARLETTQQKEKSILQITLSPVNDLSEYYFFFSASQEMLKILKGIQQFFPNQPGDQIDFDLLASLVDKYGAKSQSPVLLVSFDRTDVRRIHFADFTGWHLMNLAQVKGLHPAGVAAVRAYCRDETTASYAAAFCAGR